MKIGIMQPYFMPYLGYFQLINIVDVWIAFDTVQFIDKGWVNRNRVLHTDSSKDWQYITVPLSKRGRFDLINEIKIEQKIKWKDQILGKLSCYKRRAPFYNQTIKIVKECLNFDESNLSKFVTNSIKIINNFLEIKTPVLVLSELNLKLAKIEHPGQWALQIADKMSAKTYINPIGGRELFKTEEFKERGINIFFLESKIPKYIQNRTNFVENLSIIDYLMFNQIEDVKQALNNCFIKY